MNNRGVDPYTGQMLLMPTNGCESYGADGTLATDAPALEECSHFISEELPESITDVDYTGEVSNLILSLVSGISG